MLLNSRIEPELLALVSHALEPFIPIGLLAGLALEVVLPPRKVGVPVYDHAGD